MTSKRLGLVIGNNYPNSDKELKFAVADAIKMKEILLNKDICDFDKVVDLVDRTSKEALIEVEKILKRSENDLVFIYFSGHGKKDFENDLCLLFKDTEEGTLLSTSLTFNFINKCRRYPSRKSVIIVLDCCYSGAAGIRDTDVMEALKKHSGSGTVILTSTGLTGSPTAKEVEKLGHGVFTHYLIEGLEKGQADKKGEGYISIEDLYSYAFEKTTSSCSQSPKKEGSIEGTIFIGKNPLKIREKEYVSKKRDLFDKYITYKLPHSILNESQTVLRKHYEDQNNLGPVDEIIYGLLISFLNGDLFPENYIEALQHLKGTSVSSVNIYEKEKVNVSTTNNSKYEVIELSEVPNFGSYQPFEESEKQEITKTFISPSIGMEFVLIPAGKYIRGSPYEEENGLLNEQPALEVEIKNSFYIGRYPVTQGQWIAIMNRYTSPLKKDDLPVNSVSWNEAQEFIKKFNEIERTDKYCLPSEAEWEYACRTGKTTEYYFGNNESKLRDYAWYEKNAGNRTHPVGQKKPNGWGLYDMYGNIWEWVQDTWHDNYKGAPLDNSAWEDEKSSTHVIRGGSWISYAKHCRSATRHKLHSEVQNSDVGFRLLKKL